MFVETIQITVKADTIQGTDVGDPYTCNTLMVVCVHSQKNETRCTVALSVPLGLGLTIEICMYFLCKWED